MNPLLAAADTVDHADSTRTHLATLLRRADRWGHHIGCDEFRGVGECDCTYGAALALARSLNGRT